MKLQALKVSITSIILLIVIFISLFFIQPIYQKTSEIIQNQCIEILTKVEESTGLSISWKSISPSFLSIFQIKSVNITDSTSKKTILKINKVNCYINIFSFFSKDYSKIVSKIIFDNVSISYNQNENSELITKISSLFTSEDDTSPFISIPFPIVVKNLHVNYSQDGISSKLFFKTIQLKNNNKGLPILTTNCSGNVFLENKQFFGNKVDFSLDIQTLLYSDLSQCILQLKLGSIETQDFFVKSLEFLVIYKDSQIEIQLLKNGIPFFFLTKLDINQKVLSASLECSNLELGSLIIPKNKNFVLTSFLDSTISGKYVFNYEIEQKTFDYDVNSSIYLNKKAIESTMLVNFVLDGNNDNMYIQDLSCDSSFAKAFFTGEINLDTFQPQGILTIDSLRISDDYSVQTEVFIDPLKQGFMVFIPQLELGVQSYSAIQLNLVPQNKAIDYSLELGDYSHYEYSQEGTIACSGSIMYEDELYLQSSVSINSLFLDSILKTVQAFGISVSDSLISSTQNYVMSNDIYVSTDFKSISYNVPFFIVANTKEDMELAVMSFDGNESSIMFSQFEVMYKKQNIKADIQAEFSSDFSDIFFTTNLSLNSIPYEFNGSFVDGKQIIIEGDYDSSVYLLFEDNGINGSLKLENFPINLDKYIFSVSLATDIYYKDTSSWQISLNQLAIHEESDNIEFKPMLNCQGIVDNSGLILENVTYVDNVSTLIGNSSLLWQVNDKSFESLTLFLTLSNSDNLEKYYLQADCNNSLNKTFSDTDFLSSLFFSLQLNLVNSPTSRFLAMQTQENIVNADVSVLGTLDNPAITVSIKDSVVNLQNQNLFVQSQLVLEDNHLQLIDSNLIYGTNILSNIQANIDIKNFDGELKALYKQPSVYNEITANVKLNVFSQENDVNNSSLTDNSNKMIFQNLIPNDFNVDFFVDTITAPLYGEIPNLALHIQKSKDRIDFYTGEEKKLEGYLLNDGELALSLDKSLPMNFNAVGYLRKGEFDINLENLRVRLESFSRFINFPVFSVESGYINGDIHLGGLLTDPEFSGIFHVNDLDFTCPSFIKEIIHGENFEILVNGKDFIIDNYTFNTENGELLATIDLSLDRWLFDSIFLDLKTLEDNRVTVDLKFPIIKLDAQVACDIQLESSNTKLIINGNVLADEANGVIYELGNSSSDSENNDYSYLINLNVQIGKHGQVYYPSFETPLLRALVNPQTNLSIRFDSQQGIFEFLGDLVFKGGEISGYGRTFYLREGRLVFDDSQEFDPTITVRAEMRESDSNGDKIKIILSAQNQRLSSFEPAFSAIPSKTQTEIMEILGQNISGSGSLASIGMNIGTGMLTDVAQTMIIKDIENGLRDALKFDIFSIRSTALQNVGQIIVDNTKTLSVGNFFDNSTVYVGKYIGNSLYFDAMVHLSYDEDGVLQNESASGFSINPEIGLELESPFATIRWSIAPDIFDTKSLWIPDTSISLSWQITF